MKHRATIGLAAAAAFLAFAVTAGVAPAACAAQAPRAAAEAVEGFGSDVPFSIAVRQIVPSGYDVSWGAGVDANRIVSWSGGKAWGAVLDDVAHAAGYRAEVQGRSVRIVSGAALAQEPAQGGSGFMLVPYRGGAGAASPASDVRISPAAAASGAAPIEIRSPAASAATVPAGPPDAVVASSESWQAEAGSTLRLTLEAWAASAGWRVVWNSNFEYPLQAGARFGGDFVAAATQLVKSMGEAKPLVKAAIYKGNRVVVVSNAAEE